MVDPNAIEIIRRYLTDVSVDAAFIKKARSVVRKKLGNMLYAQGEVEEIASDAVQYVIVNSLESLAKDTSDSQSSESNLAAGEVTKVHVEAYVLEGVKNYCNTRAKRWSTDKSAGLKGKNTAGESQNKEGKSGLEEVAVRARQPILSDNPYGTEFWDEHVHTEFNDGVYDAERVAKLLIERGLSEGEIDLINDKLSGTSFADMARTSGGTADKYRKIFKRALDKANLEL